MKFKVKIRSVVVNTEEVEAPDEDAAWDMLYARIEAGATAVFLKPEAFLSHIEEPYAYDVWNEPKRLRIDNPVGLQFTDNWAYRVHTIMKKHAYSEGMQLGLLNDDIYNQSEPIFIYEQIQKPDEVVAVTISAPYVGKSDDEVHGWIAGVSIGAYNYGSGRTIHTGSRGGQYYINSNGNKTYVPKRNTSSFGW